MNVKLFQTQDRQGILVNVNIDYVVSIQERRDDMAESIQTLLEWLEHNHNDVYWDIEAYDVDIKEFEEGYQIVFVGENGTFELNEVEVQSIN